MDQIRDDLWQTSLETTDGVNNCSYLKISQVEIIFDLANTTLGNIDVLVTPGPTDGGINCLYESPRGEVYLFSGDTMIPVAGQWISQIVPEYGGNAALLGESLLRLRDVNPDIVLSSASVGNQSFIEADHDDWRHAVVQTAARPPIGST